MYFILFIILFINLIETCPLKTVDIHTGCYCGIEIDGSNYIHCHPYSINHIPVFTRSYIYEKLNLSKNSIEILTNTSFNQLKVKKIFLENNPIKTIEKSTFNLNLLHYLEELYIETINHHHHLEFLCSGIWRKFRILKLIGFHFQQYQYCFNQFPRLEKLIIEKSNIKIISHHITKLPFLYELSLINNHLKNLNFIDDDSYSSSIRILNLTYNQLQTIPYDLNIRLPHLITLDLSHNLFVKLPQINQITTLNINLSFNLIEYFYLYNNQHFLDLSSNPICTMEKNIDIGNIILNNLTNLHCDCRLLQFLTSNLTEQWNIFGNNTICATPNIFQGKFLKDLNYQQLKTTCSIQLPKHCKELTNIQEIFQTTIVSTTTEVVSIVNKLNTNLSSFRLTSFYTLFERDDLLIFWDFDIRPFSTTKFQIIIEQDLNSKNEIIRRTDYLSPYLKQYIIPNLSSNKNYYVCLLILRISFGTDKYCREIRTLSSNQTFRQILIFNRSIIFGFLIGTILTGSLLIIFAFICHLQYKRKYSKQFLNHHHQQQQRYMYVTPNDFDGTYSHSITSSPLSKYHYLRKTNHRTYLTPIPPWYNRNFRHIPPNPRSTCCFLQYHDRTLSSSTTTNRITSLSSDYSNGNDKEQMTSTSLMSNTSFDEQSNQITQNSTKHLYEELVDTQIFR